MGDTTSPPARRRQPRSRHRRDGLSYDRLVRAFEGELGRLDPVVAKSLIDRRAPWSEVKEAVERMAGAHGLMIISTADQGAVTSLSGKAKRCSLYIVGNPVIANDILDIDLGASFYVPFRIALYESGDEGGAVIVLRSPVVVSRHAWTDESSTPSARCWTKRSIPSSRRL